MSVVFGASVIEKHFTLNRELEGPDHKASLTPKELFNYINNIKEAKKMIGSYGKKVQKSEKKIKKEIQKSVFLNKDINKGYIIRKKDLIIMRPSTSIHPLYFEYLVGRRALKSLKKFNPISLKNFS